MKPPPFEYHRASSVAEAVALKARYGEDGSFLAGGQSLIPMLNFRIARPRAVIDLGALRELDYTLLEDRAVIVGALRRQRDLELDRQAQQRCPVLAQALSKVGHPTIRNRGTVAGSIAHADPSAELPVALLALDGAVRAAGPKRERRLPARELFSFHFTTTLAADELIVAVEFPNLPPRTGAAFDEVTSRHGDFALVGACAIVGLTDDGHLNKVRLAYSGIAPTAVRAEAAEAALEGQRPDAGAFGAAGELAQSVVVSVGDERRSESYRRHLVRVLTARVLSDACTRAARA